MMKMQPPVAPPHSGAVFVGRRVILRAAPGGALSYHTFMLSWLVVGVGDITRKRVLPAILAESRSRLAGIVTRHPAKAKPYGVKSWRNLASALAECDASAVYIATPVFLHAPQTIEALRSGRHVLCEKPMALDYGEALAMQH